MDMRIMDEPVVRAASRGALFVIRGDLRLVEANAIVLPTDSFANVEPHWDWIVGRGPGSLRSQLVERAGELAAAGAIWVQEGPPAVLALNVGGTTHDNSPEAVAGRFRDALEIIEASGEVLSSKPRSRPLVAMPLIGVGRGGLGARTGEVITALLQTLADHFDSRADGTRGFDVVLVCNQASDYAAVQHTRKQSASVPGRGGAGDTSDWLRSLANHAREGDLAVIFGAGASAGLDLPMWPALLEELASAGDEELARMNLSGLDSVDAATILITSLGEERFSELLRERLHRPKHALTHALLANLHPQLAITTNYDQGYELAVNGFAETSTVVLPWDPPVPGAPRLLKLHGDLDRGQIVLSRQQFVAMQAFRRPLAGALQQAMLIGHVLAVGTSMSDSTLVQAAEEVKALILRTGGKDRAEAGTVLLTVDDPARARLLGNAFKIVTGGSSQEEDVRETARGVDVLLDWLTMTASSDLSFFLDPRYRNLLSVPDRRLAKGLEEFAKISAVSDKSPPSDVSQSIRDFLVSLGGPTLSG